MAGFSGSACADIEGNIEYWSGEDEDWVDDVALSTMKVIWDDEKALDNESSSSDSDNSDSDNPDDEPGRPGLQGKPANKPKQTTSVDVIRRWITYPEKLSKTPKLPDFNSEASGITEKVDLEKTKTPLDFFRLFFDLAFIMSLVTATNSYAEETRQAEPDKNKNKWIPVTANCMAKFLGLTFLMGLIRKPTIKEYWTTSPLLATPVFKSIMSRDRFISILRYFNFGTGTTGSTIASRAMNRVNALFEIFNEKARSLYVPRQNISIDESMVAHKGRTPHTQYMPAKPTRWGLKVWVLAESVSGYVIQALPHFRAPGRAPFRIYEDIVLNLLKSADVIGKMYHLYCDNYYTSVPMLEDLANNFKIYCCGTLRKNRKFLPKALMKKKLPELKMKGDSRFSKCRDLLLCIWRDRKLIHVLSTIHGTEIGTTLRTVKGDDGKFIKKEIPCPTCIKDYCAFMGGVDLADQLYNYYCFSRKTQKWTKKMFWFLLEIMKINSAAMFNLTQTKKMPLYDFTLQILQPLFDECSINESIPKVVTSKPNRLNGGCLPMDLGRKSFCKVCYARYIEKQKELEKNESVAGNVPDEEFKRRQTRYGCGPCNAHLCMPTCFSIYHSVENFGVVRPMAKKVRTEE